MKSLFTSACIAVFTAAVAVSTAAAEPDQQITRIVHVGDLDLHTQAGAKQAALRIHVAADWVCGGDDIVLRRSMSFDGCRDRAIDRALAQLDAPLVSAALGRATSTGLAAR